MSTFVTYLLSDDPDDPAIVARARALIAAGHRVERLAPSDAPEEFIHLGPAGELVHRVTPLRGYLSKRLGGQTGGLHPHRAAEKLFELRRLWDRHVEAIEVSPGLRGLSTLRRYPWIRQALARAPSTRETPRAATHIRSVELVCCTYNRVEEPLETLPTVLREIDRARAAGLQCRLLIVPQNADTEAHLRERARLSPEDDRVAFSFSSPPGLPRARNHAASVSTAELLIFIDDDVLLDEDFVGGYVRALDAAPGALGAAGRVRSRINKDRVTQDREVGQVRLSGYVETHFDSLHDARQLVAITPIGASMAFRRERMNALFGAQWFDASLGGSAHREETTLAIELFRRGEFFVYAPKASLFHFEAMAGGCETRTQELGKQVRHYSLEYLFLNRLYQRGALRSVAPLLFAARDLKIPEARGERLRRLYLNARGYVQGRRLYASKR